MIFQKIIMLMYTIVVLRSSAVSANRERKSVVIIGAGASGLAAATRLYENGIEDIVVLEAENRIGGRVNTVDIKNGVLEMGAQWIHGGKNNVVHDLASARKLACDPPSESRTDIFARSCGQVIDSQLANKMSTLFQRVLDLYAKNATSFKSCGEFFTHYLNIELNKSEHADMSDDMKLEFIEFCHRNICSNDASDTWFNSSVSNFEEYEECEGNQDRMWNGTGYRILFDILMERSRELSSGCFESNVVALNSEVVRISLNQNTMSILVECSDRRIIEADHVIITVSLGVLRETYTKLFENMPIPELKIRSINNLDLGIVDKIYLEFSKPWWPRNCSGFNLLWTKEDREEYTQKGLGWIVDIFMVAAVDFAPNVLCGWISGASAKIMETLDETFVLKTVEQMLRKFLSKYWVIPDADRIIRSTWYSNSHFRGSYSYRSLRTDAANVSAFTLSVPVDGKKGVPVLLFAGEATSPRHYSTVHGAVESGWREADRLLSFIKKS